MRDGLETELTAIELRVDETWHPDDSIFVPIDYQGPELIVVAYAGRIVALTEHGKVVRPLPLEVATRLVQTAALARAEVVEVGVDTAIGRTITSMRVRVDEARGSAHSYTLRGAVNHCAPRSLPPMWSALLVTLRDAIGELGPDDAACWDRALTWAGPIDLGRKWHAGSAVRAPHLVTCIEPGGPLFIRTGQPGQVRPSALYRLDLEGPLLTCLDDGRVVAPDDTQLRWRLPCGGGAVTYHHEWDRPPRVVLRVDDLERGIYVERGHRR